MNDELPPFKNWKKFKEMDLMRKGPMPYFSLLTLWESEVFDYEFGTKDIVESRIYWYSLN